MKTKIELKIDKPCSENFDNFEKTTNGGFCNSCQKEVIDFTEMTNKEILEYFKNNKKETCGSFTPIQLEQNYQDYEKPKYNFFRNIGFAVFSLFSFNTIQSQIQEPTEISPKKINNENTESQIFTISGTVSDMIGPMLGVSVNKKGTDESVDTDMEGHYSFNAKPGDVLIFDFMGYDSIEKLVGNETKIDIMLKESSNILTPIRIMGTVLSKKVLKSSNKKSFWKK